MYLGYQNEKIKFYTENELDKELYSLDRVEETQDEYVLDGGEYVLKTAEWEAEQLEAAKKAKYAEACALAYEFLNNGRGLFEFEKGKHIEASGDNFAKLTPYLLDLAVKEALNGGAENILENIMKMLNGEIAGITVEWTTKEDEIVKLNVIQIIKILKGIGRIQADVWGLKFLKYKKQIEEAQTIEEVNAIVIDYGQEAENAVNIQ